MVLRESANGLLTDLIWMVSTAGVVEDTRNGMAMSLQTPTVFGLSDPRNRVVTFPWRDCNHAFHMAEFIWMMAGWNNVDPLLKFNSAYDRYAEADGKVHGAYGHRWIKHFRVNQLQNLVTVLKGSPSTRQAVVEMWDPCVDLNLYELRDRPCNTQLMFRIARGKLDMTVVNRSNDLFWGALGANVVHMTMLQETIASELDVQLGSYFVMSNNLHYYTTPEMDEYVSEAKIGIKHPTVPCVPMNVKLGPLMKDCQKIMELLAMGEYILSDHHYESEWVSAVAVPLLDAYMEKKYPDRKRLRGRIKCPGWYNGFKEWSDRRAK